MASWILCTLLLATAAGLPNSRSPPELSDYISQAVTLYNHQSEVIYNLLGVPPQDKSHDAENVTFLIKETICRSSAQNHGDCPFKEDGVVKRCSAAAQESRGRSLEVTCQDVDGSETSVRRGDDIPRTGRTPHVFKLLRSGGRKAESDFLQFDSKDAVPSHSVSSCIECIFDFLYPKPSSGR
ncbi:cathelicidin-1-like isoform X2 [Engystomops pustulosus]|uniref:cathelicidin-1-like isoform X2 n=1 Tax=Engystomops pustulosus TaxID=76066 RepID=UPI003AFB38C8